MSNYESEVREALRDWAKTAAPGDEPSDFISETADGNLIYSSTVKEIVDEGNLWYETPEIEPRDSSPMAAMQTVAYEWLESVMWEEWHDIESERNEDRIIWCEECGTWRDDDSGETMTCYDCESVECSNHTTIAFRDECDGEPLCDDCYTERLNKQAEADQE